MFQATIIGRLGRDPEQRFTQDGKSVVNLNVAANNFRKETVWVRVAVWGKQGEAVNDNLSKGSQVYIRGDIQFDPESGGPRLYERNDGSWGASFEISAVPGGVQFLGSRSDNGSSQQVEPEPEPEIDMDDVPF